LCYYSISRFYDTNLLALAQVLCSKTWLSDEIHLIICDDCELASLAKRKRLNARYLVVSFRECKIIIEHVGKMLVDAGCTVVSHIIW
jgi:hypothetical protein